MNGPRGGSTPPTTTAWLWGCLTGFSTGAAIATVTMALWYTSHLPPAPIVTGAATLTVMMVSRGSVFAQKFPVGDGECERVAATAAHNRPTEIVAVWCERANTSPRDPRCDTAARYDAMREGADCNILETE